MKTTTNAVRPALGYRVKRRVFCADCAPLILPDYTDGFSGVDVIRDESQFACDTEVIEAAQSRGIRIDWRADGTATVCHAEECHECGALLREYDVEVSR